MSLKYEPASKAEPLIPQPAQVLCDGCDVGWHLQCARPRLTSVPEGEWLCHKCNKSGVWGQGDTTRCSQVFITLKPRVE